MFLCSTLSYLKGWHNKVMLMSVSKSSLVGAYWIVLVLCLVVGVLDMLPRMPRQLDTFWNMRYSDLWVFLKNSTCGIDSPWDYS